MKRLASVLLTTALFCGCSKKPATPGQPASSSSGNPITAPVDYLDAVAKGRQSAIKNIDIVQINQAITMFNANEGRFPKDLDELVSSKMLVKVPDAPYGMKIVYDPKTGEVKVVKQ